MFETPKFVLFAVYVPLSFELENVSVPVVVPVPLNAAPVAPVVVLYRDSVRVVAVTAVII